MNVSPTYIYTCRICYQKAINLSWSLMIKRMLLNFRLIISNIKQSAINNVFNNENITYMYIVYNTRVLYWSWLFRVDSQRRTIDL